MTLSSRDAFTFPGMGRERETERERGSGRERERERRNGTGTEKEKEFFASSHGVANCQTLLVLNVASVVGVIKQD